jgi:enoyl-CoA hydratase
VPPESLLARAQEILDAISANAPIAIRLATEAVNRGADSPLPEALALERALFAVCASSEDKHEGTSAFLAKRKAVFHGR